MNPSSKSRLNITIIVIAIGFLVLALGGYLNPIIGSALQPVYAVQTWITTRYQALQDYFNAPTDISRLRERNAELEAGFARLQTEIIQLQQQVSEVEILSELLDFARAQPENQYQAAAVIARDPSPFLKYVIINKGSDDGLRRGMPVVNAQGLVGRVASVTANAARVQLIIDPSSSVNVRIQPAESDAVMRGSITGDLSLDLIPQAATVTAGNLVLTSGLGGNFPPNILIGQVNSVRQEATALFQSATIQSVVDFSRLEIVLVIINFSPIDITPLIPDEAITP
ncbi:MAG: rod shape-determining protein MreC [Anaerolineae bacterium]|nr:rod shape-determining protein MreC [Anaerolineae bacterium]